MKLPRFLTMRSVNSADERRALQLEFARPIDVDRLAHDQGVGAVARRSAQRYDVAADARNTSDDEDRITQHFRAWAARIAQRCADLVAATLARCDELRDVLTGARLLACETRAAQALERHRARSRDALVEARRRERESRLELAAFRQEHGCQRVPRAATPLMQLLLAAGAAICIEGCINAWAFAEGSDMGLLGGLYQALLIAGINVAIALAAGMSARNLFHVRSGMKALGVATMIAFVAFLATYTLLVAHYRFALARFPQDAAAQAVLRMIHFPTELYDVTTWLLVICSLAFATAAFATGLLSADLVPGYSRVHAQWAKWHARVLAMRTAYLGGIDSVTEPVLAEVGQRLREGRAARREYAQSVSAARRLIEEYGHFSRRLQLAHDDLIGRYRQIYAAIRPDLPPHFDSPPASCIDTTALCVDVQRLSEHEANAGSAAMRDCDLAGLAIKAEQRIGTQRQQSRATAGGFFAECDAMAGCVAVGTAAPTTSLPIEFIGASDEPAEYMARGASAAPHAERTEFPAIPLH